MFWQWAYHEATGWQNLRDHILWDQENQSYSSVPYYWGHKNSCNISCLVLFNYCNLLLAGIPQKLMNKVQRVINCAARLVCKAPKWEHVTPLHVDLHWLPVERRIEYKIATICYNVITCTAPHLSDLLELYALSCTLRSSADTCIFRISNRRKRFQGQCAFPFIGPSIWNNLPFPVRHSQTLSSFKSQLKTYLFSISYSHWFRLSIKCFE